MDKEERYLDIGEYLFQIKNFDDATYLTIFHKERDKTTRMLMYGFSIRELLHFLEKNKDLIEKDCGI